MTSANSSISTRKLTCPSCVRPGRMGACPLRCTEGMFKRSRVSMHAGTVACNPVLVRMTIACRAK